MADLALEILVGKINEQYPQAMALLSQPGVFQVYADAINNNWSADRITAALQNTQWWKTTPNPERQWLALQSTDPATAQQKIDLVVRQVNDIESQLGVKLDPNGGFYSPSFAFLVKAAQEGWDENRIRYELIAATKGQAPGGEVAKNAADVKSLAGQYGVPLSDQATMDWADKITQGAMTPDAVKGYLIEQAKSLFPALSSALDQGVTVQQYAAPYIQLAQQELNINPSDVNFTDKKWMTPLNQIDPKTGQRVSMSLDDWLKTLRSDPKYGYDTTDKAKQDATALATQLQTKFGAA